MRESSKQRNELLTVEVTEAVRARRHGWGGKDMVSYEDAILALLQHVKGETKA